MKKFAPFAVFGLATLLVLPFFRSGYFFLLDAPFVTAPSIGLNAFLDTSFYAFLALAKGLSLVFPLWLVQRFAFFAAVFLLGIGGYGLLKDRSKFGAYAAGFMLMFNPYVYSRMVSGQLGIVLGLAMAAFFFQFLIRYLQTGNRRDALIFSLFWTCSVMWAPHALFFVFGSLAVFLGFDAFRSGKWKRDLRVFALSAVTVLTLNANWIAGNLVGNESVTETLSQITAEHYQIFATDKGRTNLYFNALTLHGFWGERQGRFAETFADNANWKWLFLIMLAVMAFGAHSRLRDPENMEKRLDGSFLALAMVAYFLSLGIAENNLVAPVSQFLYDHVPFYSGLREPQKWSGMLLVAYAYFFGYGVSYLWKLRLVQDGYPVPLVVFTLLLPVFSAPTMLFGFGGQLRVSDYPAEWYRLKEQFSDEYRTGAKPETCAYRTEGESGTCYGVLVFPWHQYVGLSFAGRIVANPAEGFFDTAKLLQGDNMEFGPVYTQSTRKESRILEKYVGESGTFALGVDDADAEGFVRDIKGLGIAYVLVLKETDFQKYRGWADELEKRGSLFTTEDNAKFTLYGVR